jgi:D-arabinose 1-dehydrogenase-like Zn-dependent alcohol dehydrogenase
LQGGIVVLVGLAGGILPVPIGTTIMNQISVVGTYVGDKPMVGEVLQLMAEKKV